MLWPTCEGGWDGTSRNDTLQQVGTKGGFPREGEKLSQKEGQQVRAAPERGPGRGGGAGGPSQIPDSNGLHDCSFILGILASLVAHPKPESVQKSI